MSQLDEFDAALRVQYPLLCGVDEAGRGPLAGPVCCAAVILDPENPIEGLNDSKKLSEKKREALFPQICEKALAYSVVFVDETADFPIEKIGPHFENHKLFPERINTEFVKIIDENTLQMRVWERGSGETMACGTGACATAAAAVKNGISKADTDITVKLLGGDLKIRVTKDLKVYMTGPAAFVFEGELING